MSNNLTVVTGQLPAYLQGGQIGYQDSGLGAGITPRAPKLGITTAKQWTVSKGGQQLILPSPTVKCVLIASAANITKAWYAKAFVPGSTEAPDCYSDDGKTPAAGVKAPQCSNCASCPKNAFGSNTTTGRGKACSDRKRVVLVWEGAPDELMTFNVPTMSLQSLLKLDTELRNANIPLQSVLVEMSFDPAVLYPVVKIGAVGFVDQQTAMNLIAKAGDAEVSALLRESEYDDAPDVQPEADSPVPQQTVAFGQAQPQQFAPETQAQPGVSLPPIHGQYNGTVGAVQQPEKPKRTRRTKAQIEADNLAAAQAAEQQRQAQMQTTQNPVAVGAGQQMLQTMQNPAAMQQVALDATVMQQQTAVVQQPQTTAPVGGLDIAGLMSKWQNG